MLCCVSGAIAAPAWALDGNYGKVRDIVWRQATHLIWLDYSFPLVFWRIFSRTVRRAILREELLLRVERTNSYLLDADSNGQPTLILRVELADLPDDYLPADETWYDASLSVFHDQLAARELLAMMQDSLQKAQSKLKLIEQIVSRAPEVFEHTPVVS